MKAAADLEFPALQEITCRKKQDHTTQGGSEKENEKIVITCLDVEGVLVPEIWVAFAKESWNPGIDKNNAGRAGLRQTDEVET